MGCRQYRITTAVGGQQLEACLAALKNFNLKLDAGTQHWRGAWAMRQHISQSPLSSSTKKFRLPQAKNQKLEAKEECP